VTSHDQITLAPLTEESRHILRNMFTVYFCELSAWDDLVDLNAHGLPVWTDFGVAQPRTHEECADYNWWIRDSCECLLILANSRPAGFVIINTAPQYLSDGVDFEILDFFIAHKYRRRGIGRQAAKLAIARHAGNWEVCELAGNLAAVTFWNQVISDLTDGIYESLDDGARQRFTT